MNMVNRKSFALLILASALFFINSPKAFASTLPATNMSAAETYTEDTPLNLIDIVVSGTTDPVVVTLTLSNPAVGSFNIATSGAVTSTYNAGTGQWAASGDIADVNVLLAGLTFTPTLDSNGSFTIATSASDGAHADATGTKTVIGIAVNDSPSGTNLSAPESYTEDGSAVDLTDIVASDVDSATVVVTLTLSNSSAGTLSTGTSGAVTSTFSSGTWTASGAIASVNTLLAGVTFTPAANFDRNFSIATSISDGSGTVTGSKVITATAVNDAPALDSTKNPLFNVVNEDAGAPTGAVGTAVSDLIDFDIPAGGLDNVSEVDTGAVSGIAITAVQSGLTCYYSINSGSTWASVGSVSASSVRLLASGAANRLYCIAGADVSGTYATAITFRAWDQSSGANGGTADASTTGGTTAFSTATDTASLVVLPVADLPGEPTDLVVTTNSQSRISLSWTTPAIEGDSAISGYMIERESPIGGGFATVVADTGTTATTYLDTSLTPATQYNYRVSAISDAGTGDPSNEAHATTERRSSGGGCSHCSTTLTAPKASVVPKTPVPAVVATQPVANTSPFMFTRDLRLGSTGEDVKALQQFLNTHGYAVALTGIGSKGSETSYFGPRTKIALAKFQAGNSITPAAGYFGPKTRSLVNAQNK